MNSLNVDFSTIRAAFFSATGTTQKVVRHIAGQLSKSLNLPVVESDFTLPQQRLNPLSFGTDELVVFGTPVYAGRVPNVLLKYLTTMQAEGVKVIAVVVYGNRDFDDALMELSDILTGSGALLFAAGAFIGEHSFSYTLAAGRPDKDDFAKLDAFSSRIVEKIESNDFTKPQVKGVPYPYRQHFQPHDEQGRPFDMRKVKPVTTEACVGCGICASVCPMGSISTPDYEEIAGICIKCGACVKRCPHHAKRFVDANYLFHKEEVEKKNKRRAEAEWFV